jgi:hypothetical protein
MVHYINKQETFFLKFKIHFNIRRERERKKLIILVRIKKRIAYRIIIYAIEVDITNDHSFFRFYFKLFYVSPLFFFFQTWWCL